MTFKEYQAAALRTANPNQASVERLNNAALGLAGESGEFADLVKKMQYQYHTFDAHRFQSELGDILWYIALACDTIGCTIEDIANINVAKLTARYPEGFDKDKSVTRAAGDL